jgi:hypothetical protein
MSVAAIPAQGTTLHIAGSPASAEPLTAITLGFPTILAITGHAGVANGDVVTLANFTGTDAGDLNGHTFVVTHYATGTSNDTFAIDYDSTLKTITIGTATATPTAWIKVGQMKTIKPSGSSAPDIDVTDLDSTAKEFRTGLRDPGSMTMDNFCLDSDTGQAAILAAFAAQTAKSFKVTYPSGATPIRTFTASVKKFPEIADISTDGVLTGSIELKISGAVTVS